MHTTFHRIQYLTFLSLLLFLFQIPSAAQDKKQAESQSLNNTAGTPRYAVLNINQLSTWLRSDGQSNHSPGSDYGLYFPRFTSWAVYQDGIIWGAKAYRDQALTQQAPFDQLIRVGGASYSIGTAAGRINGIGALALAQNPNEASARIYRIRRDYKQIPINELRMDAAEVNEKDTSEVTDSQMQTVLAQYEKDWNEWPVAVGAPFIDRNGNGEYDKPPVFTSIFTVDSLISGNYDEPGISGVDPNIPADQVIWTVYNDLNRSFPSATFYSEPLGLELQKTVWGYKRTDALGKVYFTRLRLINKGGVEVDGAGTKGAFFLDSMYVSQWSDPDLGAGGDDLAGCDTILSMGFVYNGNAVDNEYDKYSLPPPAVGYSVMLGPMVSSLDEVGVFDFNQVPDTKNLPMTSFAYFSAGSPYYDPPGNSTKRELWYKVLRGYAPLYGANGYYNHPPGTVPGPFPLSGDPVTQSGFLDGQDTGYSYAQGDKRFVISAGPVQLAPGDSQEVVFATVVGLGADRFSSISIMKSNAHAAKSFFASLHGVEYVPTSVGDEVSVKDFVLGQNYPNPFNPTTVISFQLPVASSVTLKVYNALGQEVAELVNERLNPGNHVYLWDGRDMSGQPVASGLYFYKLVTDRFAETKKMILLK